MNKRMLIVLVAIVITVHAVVISMLFSGSGRVEYSAGIDSSDDEQTTEFIPDNNAFVPEENIIVPESISYVAQNTRSERFPWEEPFNPPVPLDYTSAIRGNIGSIPGTSKATSGILVDLDTRRVLWAKNADRSFPVASMSKIMTMLLAFEMIHLPDSIFSLSSVVPVTREAEQIPPSRVDLRRGEVFTIQELLVAVSVRSANDASYLLAQFLGNGSADKFVEKMNKRAGELGMSETRFFNPHGLPGKTAAYDNVSSPADMVKLCVEFMRHPQLVELASIRRADFRKVGMPRHLVLVNHNNLLPGGRASTPGVNGIKTGYIQRSGFCVAASCERNSRRMLLVVTGFPSARERDETAKKIFDWAYAR